MPFKHTIVIDDVSAGLNDEPASKGQVSFN